MADKIPEHYLFDVRDPSEVDRLNKQSKVLLALRSGHVLEPIIPKDSLEKIADVGTGTGIWIQEAFEELSEAGNHSCDFLGFDISSAMFPTQESSKSSPYLQAAKFELANINEGFPQHYHGQFDLVHVRLLMLAIETGQVRNAVENVLKLLKPGGYLQWTEPNWGEHEDLFFPETAQDSMVAEGKLQTEFIVSMRWSKHLLLDVAQTPEILHTCEASQLEDYFEANFEKPQLQETLWKHHVRTMGRTLNLLVLRNGAGEEEAERTTRAYEDKVERMGRAGVVFPALEETLVARKKSGS